MLGLWWDINTTACDGAGMVLVDLGRFCIAGCATYYFQNVGLKAIAMAETVGVNQQLIESRRR